MNNIHTIESMLDKLDHDEDAEIDIMSDIPDELAAGLNRAISIKALILPNGEVRKLKVELNETLDKVMQRIAAEFNLQILPPAPQMPLDELFVFDHHNELKGPLDLSTTLFKVIVKNGSRKLGLKLNLSIKVNARWKVAPKDLMTPREILALFDMDPSQFTLYAKGSANPLPIDEALKLTRGEPFEAMKDGRYGGR